MKKHTRKELILKILSNPKTKLTCTEITKKIIAKQNIKGNIARYLSGSISGILNKMVKDGLLKYAKEKGPRNGYKYQRSRNNSTK